MTYNGFTSSRRRPTGRLLLFSKYVLNLLLNVEGTRHVFDPDARLGVASVYHHGTVAKDGSPYSFYHVRNLGNGSERTLVELTLEEALLVKKSDALGSDQYQRVPPAVHRQVYLHQGSNWPEDEENAEDDASIKESKSPYRDE